MVLNSIWLSQEELNDDDVIEKLPFVPYDIGYSDSLCGIVPHSRIICRVWKQFWPPHPQKFSTPTPPPPQKKKIQNDMKYHFEWFLGVEIFWVREANTASTPCSTYVLYMYFKPNHYNLVLKRSEFPTFLDLESPKEERDLIK